MTRATRQLWEERERFLKFERGYNSDLDDDDEIEGLDLNQLTLEEQEILKEIKAETKAEEKAKNPVAPKPEIDFGPRPELLSERDKQRLIAVEKFYVSIRYARDLSRYILTYHSAMPYLTFNRL
jgi:hypothetical protein